ncbi:MarR family transcriptional regulator [Flavimobilis soli]|uniref:MarR family transcriptional regulator n=1 Tax=Flavimobilis soli TaxID=442709 RepID=A0A2A9EFB3_9MICO|nr:MarR family transcriptional regulator [Flavimobilis soli]PFG37493.1 MarR family transcriptional regulator [Flavimobilis soli]
MDAPRETRARDLDRAEVPGSATSTTRATRSDEVDRIVAAWNRERPDLDVGPLEVLSRVARLTRHLDRARRGVFAAHRLEHWEFDVLVALRRAGAPYQLSPGALIQQTLVTSGTMTNRIDRLEARGLVERHRSAEDRRGVIVRLTADGLALVDSAFAALLAEENELLSDLDPAGRAQLATLLRVVLAHFDDAEGPARAT